MKSHPTAVELHAIVRQRLPKISLGTIYRNLELMHRKSIIRKLNTGGGRARFDGDLRNHNHIHCIDCGRIDDLHGTPVAFAEKEFVHSNGYEVFDYRLDLVGLCPECRKKKKIKRNS